MAESLVQVTEGVGKKLHTNSRVIGANTVEDEFVIQGEYPYASYVVEATPGLATANDHLLAIAGLAGAAIRIRRIRIWQAAVTTSTAFHNIELWRTTTTTPSGGSAVTPRPWDTADAASSATVQRQPVTKGTESVRLVRWFPVVVSAASAGAGPLVDMDWTTDNQLKPLLIPAGATNGIAIKNISTQAAGSVQIQVDWVEAGY